MDHDPPIQDMDRDESLRSPAATALREALLCISCGHDLRGSLAAGRCPECGARILGAGLQTLARFGEVAWLKRAARGVKLWVCAVSALLPVSLVFAVQLAGIPDGMESDAWWVLLGLVIIAGDLAIVVAAYGYWAISTDHPVIDRAERRINSRGLMRLALALMLIGTLTNPIHCPPILWRPSGAMLFYACVLLFGTGIPIGVLGLTWRVASLCRLASANRSALLVRWAGLAFAAAWVAGAASLVVSGLLNLPAPPGFVCFAMAILFLGLPSLYTPGYLLEHFRAALEELAKVKREAPAEPSLNAPDDGSLQSLPRSEEHHES